MATDVTIEQTAGLRPVPGHGPLRGLGGLTSAEFRRWFPARALAFAIGGAGLIVGIYAVWLGASTATGDPRLALLVYPLYAIWAFLLILVMVAAAQGAVANEIEDGTAAWIVAKPVGRPAFILSKFLAAVPAVLIGAIAVPGIVARVVLQNAAAIGDTDFTAHQVVKATSDRWARLEYATLADVSRHAAMLVLLAFVLLFVVAVMILLGCVIRSRATIFLIGLAVPGLLLAFGLLGPEGVVELTPAWALDALVQPIRNEPGPVLWPVVVVSMWCAATLAMASWWFSRKEL